MLLRLKLIVCCLFLYLPFSTSAMADLIHWEFSGQSNPPSLFESQFITGGFDYNTGTGTVSNITVQSGDETVPNCFICHNFANSTATIFDNGITFDETILINSGDLIDIYFSITFNVSTSTPENPQANFDFSTPGTVSNVALHEIAYLRLDDPFNPDIYDADGCRDCITAVGSLLPVPEPETYAMVLSGLGLIGFVANRRKKMDAKTA